MLKLLADDATSGLAEIVAEESRKLLSLSIYIEGFRIALDAFSKEMISSSQTTSESGKSLMPIFYSLDQINQGLLGQVSGYYPIAELGQLDVPPKFEPKSIEEKLVERLYNCSPGKENWKEHQTLCKDILQHCLCPPLLEPEEQVGTSDKLHRRDIIMHIPHSAEGLWHYILNRFGMAVVVECKNYSEALDENDVLVSSKYLGPEKLTSLGILMARKGLKDSGKVSQQRQWKESGKLILCLVDDDLKKMLELKGNQDDPGKVLDGNMREFLESLS